MSSPATQQPSPQLFFQTINAYQRTEGLKAAIELEVFSAIGEGNRTATEIAKRCSASERGTRILCDFLCIMGFLNKEGNRYSLTQDSAIFLDKRSPAYLGGITEFISTPDLTDAFKNLAGIVRKGGTTMSEGGTVSPEKSDLGKVRAGDGADDGDAGAVAGEANRSQSQREVESARHRRRARLYGIEFAKNNPQAEVVALDWAPVLEVAKDNAKQAGVAERYSTLPGSAFDVDYGTGYDVVLLTNFLHHFDIPNNEKLLRKFMLRSMKAGALPRSNLCRMTIASRRQTRLHLA